MLEIVEIRNFIWTDIPEKLVPVIKEIEERLSNGERIVLKKKIIKSGVYLNVYIYDKTSWKYLLTQSIKME